MSTVTEYEDLSGISTVLKLMLGAGILVAVVGLWSGLLEIGLLQRAADGAALSESEALANDGRQALIGLLYLLVYLATVIVFGRWIFRANRNAWALAGDLDFRPGWAVGWYFVPVANLWKPYQAMKETFKASNPEFGADWRQAPPPAFLGLWWTLWLVAGFLGQAVFRTSLSAETVDEILTASWLTFASDTLDIGLGVVAIILVATMQEWQERKAGAPVAPPEA